MARIIPDQLPPETVSQAEKDLFYAFKNGLDKTYTVLHSLPWLDDSRGHPQEGECDFLVLHPFYGLLAIEAKSGQPYYDGPYMTWRYVDDTKSKDPVRQAEDSAHFLNKLLRDEVPDWAEVRPPFGHAVAFPHADRLVGVLPINLKPEILILRSDLQNLQGTLEHMSEWWRRPERELSDAAFAEAIKAILPMFRVVSSVSTDMVEQKNLLLRLTERQIQGLDFMAKNRRMVFEGCAGSGKTILAIEKATQLAHQGANVLMVCFSIPLAQRIREGLQSRNVKGTDVFHFHDLCKHVVEETGEAFTVDSAAGQDFWDTTAAELLSEALPAFSKRYDAILVDEGQDFCDLWWIPLEQLLSDREASSFYIFHDPHQNIFRRDDALPFSQPVFSLPSNCRNTVQIAEFVHQLARMSTSPTSEGVKGEEPVLEEVHSDHEELEAVRTTLHEMVNEEGLRTDQVVILGHRGFRKSIFAENPKLGNFTIIDSPDPGGPNEIRYTTLHKFKGLEADCVIVTGEDGGPQALSDDARRAQLYVACSRARFLLYIYYRKTSELPEWLK